MSSASAVLPWRGYLLHITHYDPTWVKNKEKEQPFDLGVGLELIDAAADAGLNLLLVDVKDGVKYASHPELARHYSQPMETLHILSERARQRGLEVVIKLNFAQSERHQHNHWFRPHNDLFDRPEYWHRATQIIDELIAATGVKRFFHIGMDEDHWRSYRQYVTAIQTLHRILLERRLRTIIWNDTACCWPGAEIHKDKSLLGESLLPRDIIQVPWNYADEGPLLEETFGRIRRQGFDLWGAPGGTPKRVQVMRDLLLACGGSGILLTRWIPCIPANRQTLLEYLRTVAPLCAQPA